MGTEGAEKNKSKGGDQTGSRKKNYLVQADEKDLISQEYKTWNFK